MPIPVFLFAGQSNAQGDTGLAVPSHLQTTDAGILTWTGSTFEVLENGVNGSALYESIQPTTAGTWGPEAEFCYQHRLRFPGRDICIVKFAIGATQLASTGNAIPDWHPSNTNEYFDQMEDHKVAALTALLGQDAYVAGTFWYQGETDGLDNTLAAAYQTNLEAFAPAARDRWGSPIFIGKLSNGFVTISSANRALIRSAQVNVVAANPSYLKIVDTDSFEVQNPDAIHFTANGLVSLGAAFFDAFDVTNPYPKTRGASWFDPAEYERLQRRIKKHKEEDEVIESVIRDAYDNMMGIAKPKKPVEAKTAIVDEIDEVEEVNEAIRLA